MAGPGRGMVNRNGPCPPRAPGLVGESELEVVRWYVQCCWRLQELPMRQRPNMQQGNHVSPQCNNKHYQNMCFFQSLSTSPCFTLGWLPSGPISEASHSLHRKTGLRPPQTATKSHPPTHTLPQGQGIGHSSWSSVTFGTSREGRAGKTDIGHSEMSRVLPHGAETRSFCFLCPAVAGQTPVLLRCSASHMLAAPPRSFGNISNLAV